MAVIAVDSSGHVGQPPIFFVAARIKEKNGRIIHDKQTHNVFRVKTSLHNTFINKDQTWRLKLSAILIYQVMIPLLRTQQDKIVIDTDFDVSNRKIVKRYLDKLLFTYHKETPLQQCNIEFVSRDDSRYIRIVDSKTKLARRNRLKPIYDSVSVRINEDFEILRKIQ